MEKGLKANVTFEEQAMERRLAGIEHIRNAFKYVNCLNVKERQNCAFFRSNMNMGFF